MHTIVIRSDGIKRVYIDGQLEGETVISSTEESTSQQDGINHPIFTTENQPFIIGGMRTTSGYRIISKRNFIFIWSAKTTSYN